MTDSLSMLDNVYMRRALELAALGRGSVSPNPMVGCVIVHNDRIIGEGWHQRYGDWHAEVNAVNDALTRNEALLLPESTVYVTLEPCSHFGKTPPCADLLIEKQVKRVVICNDDPNPLVAGKGIQKLRDAGIDVTTGVLTEEGRKLNARFFTFFEKKRPYVILKWAETADGFIADEDKQPLTISCRQSRTLSHQWRTQEDAILVGTNTALNDNPQLNARLWAGHNPVRIVLDRTLRLPRELHLFDNSQKTICYNAFTNEEAGATTFVQINFDDMFLDHFFEDLHHRKIQSVLVEGGSQLLQAFLNDGRFDEIRIVKSPNPIGKGTSSPLLPPGVRFMTQEKIGVDWLAYFEKEG
ncbi:bifunctional diaminohydroxyphosphoribosylaminopyrimidine deaminase/5-amino-6-(5-phosphoribosylamino)uracil reductase RibD [Runella salmonicolor]|uniref:Riboflavin biosynthesis protein RibD n=1 Tax=Runella salmonicolor TaxID=2950278 RepID=A0ABT1FQI5_9BACT|nr:bifunctional diaminohydroxyphosphoribosylaminopyrimidine deaminase/5-amino-6-(5-phosphoribosylamino)uracil reductase RibD [Runella salmonicolor]MCP1383984.1 bifunctional diaminohydroxyphosphoribosylaminopyrimidine deaminase/5-amino-6-(5-phosphoribosylamino)uracil reductase RibD [Runella salmonicolor]